jgi:hypothetical protein
MQKNVLNNNKGIDPLNSTYINNCMSLQVNSIEGFRMKKIKKVKNNLYKIIKCLIIKKIIIINSPK